MFKKSNEVEEIKNFGLNIRKLRKERKLSMQKLANIAEIEISQIYRIETGKINPKLTTILSIARALEVSSKELMAD
jgi:transcriptional regulator with XRE-family HTH domain